MLDGLDITSLRSRFGRHLFLAGGAETRNSEIVAQAIGTVLRDLRKGLTQFFVRELAPLGKQFGKIVQNTFGCLHVFRIAVDVQGMAVPVDLNIKQRFEVLDVLIVNAEKRFQPFWWKLNLLQMMKLSPSWCAVDLQELRI